MVSKELEAKGPTTGQWAGFIENRRSTVTSNCFPRRPFIRGKILLNHWLRLTEENWLQARVISVKHWPMTLANLYEYLNTLNYSLSCFYPYSLYPVASVTMRMIELRKAHISWNGLWKPLLSRKKSFSFWEEDFIVSETI